jgi:hypothetical protein
VAASLIHANRRTEMKKPTDGHLSDFANESKMSLYELGYDNIERTYIVSKNGMEAHLIENRHVHFSWEHSEIGIRLNYGYAFCSQTQSSVSKHLA